MNENNKGGFKLSYLLFVLLAVLLLVVMFSSGNMSGTKIAQQDYYALVDGSYKNEKGEAQKMDSIFYSNGYLYILVEGSENEKNFPKQYDYYFDCYAEEYEAYWKEIEAKKGVDPNFDISYSKEIARSSWLMDNFPTIIILVFTAVMFFMLFKSIAGSNKGAMSFGKSMHLGDNENKI